MLSELKIRTTCEATSREMSRSLEQKTSDAVKEKILPVRADMGSRDRDKFGNGHSLGQPYSVSHRELRQRGITEHVVQVKSSKNHQMTQQGSKMCKDDELVKHMSNLPSFLQQVEKEKSVQEKALNFGVLDWKQLEKWKYNERMPAKCHRKTSSTSNNSLFMASGPPKISSHLKKQLMVEGKQQSKVRSTYINDLQARNSAMDGQQENFKKIVNSCGKVRSEVKMNDCERHDLVKKVSSEKEALNLGQDADEERSKTRFKDEVNLTPQYCTVEAQNIVLLVPKHFAKTSCSETSQFPESKMLSDGQTLGHRTRFSDCFSREELHSGEFASASDVPHSCPLPTSSMIKAECDVGPRNLVNAEDVDSECCTSVSPDDRIVPPKRSEAKRSFSLDASRQMYVDTEEKPGKGRHPSPTRRFSFSLGKMTRSFSFKEGLGVPQLSSTHTAPKSGTVGPELSSSMESYDKEKAGSSSRGRSSPLRRLLEPLLKHKGAHSAEIVAPPAGSSRAMPSKPMYTDGPIQDRKCEVISSHTSQALVQLSVKNGLPFFKLAADNSSNVLAAAVKKLPSSGKGDCSLIYTFYSVHEIKKKSMIWINQGLKGKSCGLGYNIVAQMNISSSNSLQLSSNNSSQCVIRECVLYGSDLNKQTPELLSNREMAAIVIKNTQEKQPKEEDLSDKSRPFRDRESVRCVLGEEENPNSTVVILPGGVHGLPNKGAPSPLISRWKSGGSCDCGGWDVGCKLQILTNQERPCNITGPSMHSSAADRLDLFLQGGDRGNMPNFSLEPTSNGFYSVEFNSSISLLEAFSVCVAIITSQKLSQILEMNDLLPETAPSTGCTLGKDMTKSQTTLQVPVKYVSCPPSSPVGRI